MSHNSMLLRSFDFFHQAMKCMIDFFNKKKLLQAQLAYFFLYFLPICPSTETESLQHLSFPKAGHNSALFYKLRKVQIFVGLLKHPVFLMTRQRQTSSMYFYYLIQRNI